MTAAGFLVRERGVAALSLDAVEGAAGVGRSQLYHYFRDRDDLLRAVLSATIDRVLSAQGGRLDSLADIDDWFARSVAFAAERDGAGGCPIGSLVNQYAEGDEVTRAMFADAFARWESPLLDGLGSMQRRGELRADVDVTDLADLTMAALQGGLLLAQVRRDAQQLSRALAGARTAIVAAAPA